MVTSPADNAAGPLGFARKAIAWSGKGAAWLTLLMVLLTFTIVILRYGFNLGWIWLQESLTYLHVAVFTIVSAWALQTESHVRVDIFYTRMSPRGRALVDLLGTLLFLLPFCVFILVTAWPYVMNSWALLEGSREAGGLPLVFLLKSLILVMPALLLGQALVNAIDAWDTLRSEQPA
jgi:TRAP-type mannitol/chloroaromatic compound transport system permease small subunit